VEPTNKTTTTNQTYPGNQKKGKTGKNPVCPDKGKTGIRVI
jgi:hypothetical protein